MSEITLRRSQLVTPASERGMLRRAAASDADEVIVDLEDSVTGPQKGHARERLVTAVSENAWTGKHLSYRINGIDTRWWYDDVIEVVEKVGDRIDTLVVPKVSEPSDVATVANLLAQVERNADLETGVVSISPQIEGGAGMHNVYDVVHASDRLDSVVFGPGDYAARMGAPGLDIGQFPDYRGHYWHYALSHINAAAKSAGLNCSDGPYSDIEDQTGFRSACENANMLGCDGTWVIHPAQIDVANDVFAPDEGTARRAEELVAAYAKAKREDRGAVKIDGQMVDEATNRMAREIVERAKAANVL